MTTRTHSRASKYDWPRIVLRLHRVMKYEDIADHLGLDASAVRQWVRRNTCPKYDDGEWLLAAFREHVSDQIPMKGEVYAPDHPSVARGGEGPAKQLLVCNKDSAEAAVTSGSADSR
jgi:uncharacterized protein YjcR